MLRSILVGVSGTPALESKIYHAIDLAKQHKAMISLLAVIDADKLRHRGPVPMGAGHHARRMSSKRIDESYAVDEAAVETFVDRAKANGVEAQAVFAEGDPFEEIQRHWRYHDVLILGLRGWFDHGLVDEPETALADLIKNGVRPLLAVPEQPRAVKNVLVAYNGTLESAKAMKHFLQLGGWPGCNVHVACVGEPRTGEEVHGMLEKAARYCRGYDQPVTTAHVHEDDDVQGLLDHAHAIEADLIVMGGSYRRLLLAQRFGRATVAMIKRSPLPLFISH